jgi:hypothetical protein
MGGSFDWHFTVSARRFYYYDLYLLHTQEAGFLGNSLQKKTMENRQRRPDLASIRTRITEFAIVHFYFFVCFYVYLRAVF